MQHRHLSTGVAFLWFLAAMAALAADPVEEKYDSGKTKLKYAVDDKGRKNGSYEAFAEDGKPTLKAQYKADQLDGSYTAYHVNGKVRLTATYKADKLNGTSTEFDERGQKTLTLTYRNGKLHGPLTQYVEREGELLLELRGRRGAHPQSRHAQEAPGGDRRGAREKGGRNHGRK